MFYETDGNHGPLGMILHRDHGGFGAQRPVIAFDKHAIGKLQRLVDRKQDFARSPELNDGFLQEAGFVFLRARFSAAIAVPCTVAVAAAKSYRNPHRNGPRKESRQAADDIRFERANSCLVGHENLDPGELGQASLPSSRFGRLRGGSLCFIGIH